MTRTAAAGLWTIVLLGVLAVAPATAEPPQCFRHKDGSLRCPQGSRPCMADALGSVFCSPLDGGIDVNNFGQPLCGPGYCTRDWKGDVFCSKNSRGASDVDMYGKPVCVGGCVPGQAELCVRPTAQ